MKRYIKSASSPQQRFINWYNKLNAKKKAVVDEIASENDITSNYEEADEEELEWLKEEAILVFPSKIHNDKLPKILKDRPYFFQLRGGNPTWGDDILRVANSLGGIKVYFHSINDKTGKLYSTAIHGYAVSDPQIAQDILDEVNRRGIVTIDREVYPHQIDWANCYMIYVDDYKKGDIKLEYHNYWP